MVRIILVAMGWGREVLEEDGSTTINIVRTFLYREL